MASLAKLAGVVKGTLYLYFKTREEVFLTLHTMSLVRWSQTFVDQLRPDMSDHDYASELYKTAIADGSFVPLLIRLEHVIEHNVSMESLIKSKRVFIERVDYIAEKTVPILTLTKTQAAELVRTMGVLLIGTSSTDQRPSLIGEIIPSDVQELVNLFSSETLFIKNACRIIAGIRTEVSET